MAFFPACCSAFVAPIKHASIRCGDSPSGLGDNDLPEIDGQSIRAFVCNTFEKITVRDHCHIHAGIMAPKTFSVTVHLFASPTPSSCAYERGNSSSRNALVFTGGLTDGPHTTPWTERLVEALQDDSRMSYSFWEFRMRSSYTGFGYSSLANDAEDIAALVKYLKGLGKEQIVLLGSSTGMFLIYSEVQGRADDIHQAVKPSLPTPILAIHSQL